MGKMSWAEKTHKKVCACYVWEAEGIEGVGRDMVVADEDTEVVGSDILRVMDIFTCSCNVPCMRYGIGQLNREGEKNLTHSVVCMAAKRRLTFLSLVIANQELFKSDRKTFADLLACP